MMPAIMLGLSLVDLAFVAQTKPAPSGGMPMANMVMWLKADAQSLEDYAYPLYTWPDSSGAADLVSTINTSPYYVTNQVNSKPAFLFYTFNGYWANFTATRTVGNSYHVLVVGNLNLGNYPVLLSGDATGASNQIAKIRTDNAFMSAYNGGTQPSSTSAPSDIYSAYTLIEWVNDSGAWDFRMNGASIGTVTDSIFDGTALFNYIGSRSDNDDGADGMIAEIVVYNAVGSAADQLARRQFLRAKYALY
jgi:hypothetical protein